jgi:NTP pyrophosphatase (non-canonical NTP hydrolase)
LSEFEELKSRLRAFAMQRDWEKFHTPKNLAMALAGESGELLAEFQWLTPEESANLTPEQLKAIEMEIADVAIYLIRLADVMNVNIFDAANLKLSLNEKRFPAN